MEEQINIEYDLKGTLFLVDSDLMELRQKDDPENVISFFGMQDRRTHYECDYDSSIKNIIPSFMNAPNPACTETIQIPPLKELDPVGTCKKYGKTMAEIAGSCDYALLVGQDPLRSRLHSGMLPVLDIKGHPFYVDLRMDALRPKDDFSTMGIDISQVNPHQRYFSLYYHIPSRTAVEQQDLPAYLPQDLAWLVLPGPARLDPVGFARKVGLAEDHYLKTYPLVMYRQAAAIPLTAMDIAQLNSKAKDLREQQLKPGTHQQSPPPGSKKKGRKLN